MIRCSVGVFAYNEEESIIPVLYALLAQRLKQAQIDEIIVIASGCTDRTIERAQQVASQHPLIRVDEEEVRRGKASAINRLISIARGEVIVMVGADTLPDPNAIEALTAPFARPDVGMTGARVVPLNNPRKAMGKVVQLLWHVHHRMALHRPKLGELVAFRHAFPSIPTHTATDEVAIEALLTEQGYHLVYTPEAIVYNYGPETVADFILQRRRIFVGHLGIAKHMHYVAASLDSRVLLELCLDLVIRFPRMFPSFAFAALMEAAGRVIGTLDMLLGEKHTIWKTVRSTKKAQRQGQALHLAVLSCGNAHDTKTLREALRQLPAHQGSLIWWDAPPGDIVFLIAENSGAETTLAQTVAEIAARNGIAQYACQMVVFPAWSANADPLAAGAEGAAVWASA